MLLLLEPGIMFGRGGTGGTLLSPFDLTLAKFVFDIVVGWLEGGVELPYAELRVEEDFCDGTGLSESFEEPEV